jgi:transposase
MAKLTEGNKRDIVKAFGEGVKKSVIAKRFDISLTAVENVARDYVRLGDATFNSKKLGRKALKDLTDEQKENKLLRHEVEELKGVVELQKKWHAYLENLKIKKEK